MKRSKVVRDCKKNYENRRRVYEWLSLLFKFKADAVEELRFIYEQLTGDELDGPLEFDAFKSGILCDSKKVYIFLSDSYQVKYSEKGSKYPIHNKLLWPWSAREREPPKLETAAIAHIASFLDTPEIGVCMLVCKDWCKAFRSDSVWRPFYYRYRQTFHSYFSRIPMPLCGIWKWLNIHMPRFDFDYLLNLSHRDVNTWFLKSSSKVKKFVLASAVADLPTEKIELQKVAGERFHCEISFHAEYDVPPLKIYQPARTIQVHYRWGRFYMKRQKKRRVKSLLYKIRSHLSTPDTTCYLSTWDFYKKIKSKIK